MASAWFRDYYWIPRYVFNIDVNFDFVGASPKNGKFIFLADRNVMKILSMPEHKDSLSVQQLFRFSKPIEKYEHQLVESLPYPDLSVTHKREIVGDYGGPIEMRANYRIFSLQNSKYTSNHIFLEKCIEV